MRFAAFFTLKPETIAAAMEHPSDRVAAVSAAMQPVGGRVLAYYWMFGPWDGMVIGETPDSTSAAAVSLGVSSTGAFGRVECYELVAAEELTEVLGRARQVRGAFVPPGAS